MARFPKVQRPCPVKDSLAEFMDGDICRLCKREVHDLNGMSDDERVAFMASCKDDVCVSYSISLKGLAAAAALSAATVAAPVAAQDTLIDVPSSPVESQEELFGNERDDLGNLPKCADDFELIDIIIVGGIKNPSEVEYIDTEDDLEIPELPVAYEDA